MEEGVSEPLRLRYEFLLGQLVLANDLAKLREKALQFDGKRMRVVSIGTEYEELFRKHGIMFVEGNSSETVRAIAGSPIRLPIIQSLHHWFGNDNAARTILAPILDKVDSQDLWRVQLRTKVIRGDFTDVPGWTTRA
jgi:hypothetical protein